MSDREIREAERRCLDDPDDLDADLHRIALLRRVRRLPFNRIRTAARLRDPVAVQAVAPAVTRPIHLGPTNIGGAIRAVWPLRLPERAALALHVVESMVDSPADEAFARPFIRQGHVWIRRPIRQNLLALSTSHSTVAFAPCPLSAVAASTHGYLRFSRSDTQLLRVLDHLRPADLRVLCADLLLLRPRSIYARILRDPGPKGPAP